MKRTLIFIISLGLSLSLFFILSETVFAFQWIDRGITIRSQEETDEGTRLIMADQNNRSFTVVADAALLTDPNKEAVLTVLKQVQETYNLPATNIQFDLKPGIFKVTLILGDTDQIYSITYEGRIPPESMIPTSSSIVNEFGAWEDFALRTLQLTYKRNAFQAVAVSDKEFPLISIQIAESQPQKKTFSDFAVLFNETEGWRALNPESISFSLGKNLLNLDVRSQDGDRSLNIVYAYPLSDESLSKVSALYKEFTDWRQIEVRRILISARTSDIDATVVPLSIESKGKEIRSSLPAGIALRYDDKIHYNFRVVSGEYFVRLANDYQSERNLMFQIREAFEDPVLYIRKNDPEYFYRQVEGIRNRHASIYNELSHKMDSSVNTLEAKNQDLSSAYSILQSSHDNLKTSHDELLASHKTLLTAYEILRQSHERFIYGVITLENAGFMSTEAVDKKAINRIIDLKNENPEMTLAEIENALEQEQLDVSDKVIHVVLSLYFNDFKQ